MEEINHDTGREPYEAEPEEIIKQSPNPIEYSENQNLAMATRNLHKKLIVIQAVNYRKHGYTNIKVNHSNSTLGQPEQIGGYTPDLSAMINSKMTICEVETMDSLNDIRTIEKWREFDRGDCKFHLMIPFDALAQVKDIAKSHGITIDKYWCSKYS